jgi:hypothetical protein
MREWQNQRNGGRERAYRKNGRYFIDSDWGSGFDGNLIPVSRRDMLNCLQFTGAPTSIIADILDDNNEETETGDEITYAPFDGDRGAGSMGQPID